MEKNLKKLLEIKKIEMEKAFTQNNMELKFMENKEELIAYLKTILVDQKKIAVGGSVTLDQTGVLELIRESPIHFIDRYEKNLSREQIEERFKEAFFADVFLTSTNALTMDGHLYNVDGTGNRVAAMIYGPKEVIVIAGLNKIFESEDQAIQHIKNVSAPANAIRLNKTTPCTKVGHCMECHNPDRICSSYVKLGYQAKHNRIKVILIEENLGY